MRYAFVVACTLLAIAYFLAGCGTQFGTAQQNEVGGIAATLAYCNTVGRACFLDAGSDATSGPRCFDKYDLCVVDAGLRK